MACSLAVLVTALCLACAGGQTPVGLGGSPVRLGDAVLEAQEEAPALAMRDVEVVAIELAQALKQEEAQATEGPAMALAPALAEEEEEETKAPASEEAQDVLAVEAPAARSCFPISGGFFTFTHDNKVKFHGSDGNDLTSLHYDIQFCAVTEGQPFEGMTRHGDTLNFRAGRKGSTEIANDFRSDLGSDNYFGLKMANFAAPPKLNFAFTGELAFHLDGMHVRFPSFHIAQGHAHHHNNWWIGSRECRHERECGPHLSCLLCTSSEGHVLRFSERSMARGNVFEVKYLRDGKKK